MHLHSTFRCPFIETDIRASACALALDRFAAQAALGILKRFPIVDNVFQARERHVGMGQKLNHQESDRRCSSLFLFTRVDFGYLFLTHTHVSARGRKKASHDIQRRILPRDVRTEQLLANFFRVFRI